MGRFPPSKMKILLVILLLLPSSISTYCGICDDVWMQKEWERKMDEDRFACRSCRDPIAFSAEACPDKGYECYEDWPISPDLLTADSCVCAEAKCAKNARLIVNKRPANSKFRCNNHSEWTVNGAPADNVICAYPCDKRMCKDGIPGGLEGFGPLKREDPITGCAIGKCDSGKGMVALRDDGGFDRVVPENEVTCTGDGKWKREDSKWKFVMCDTLQCGPTKCETFKEGSAMDSGEVVKLEVKGNGKDCASATCDNGYTFVEVDGDGNLGNPVQADGGLFCHESGKWQGDDKSKYISYVMCKQPDCPTVCNSKPLSLSNGAISKSLIQARRDGCSYSCDSGMSMFGGYGGGYSLVSAECAATRYSSPDLPFTVSMIGCWDCDLKDQQLNAIPKERMPTLTKCVASCGDGFDLQYSTPGKSETAIRVAQLRREIKMSSSGDLYSTWIDARNEITPPENPEFECVRSGTAVCRSLSSPNVNHCTAFVRQNGETFSCMEPGESDGEKVECTGTHKYFALLDPEDPEDYDIVEELTCDKYGEWRESNDEPVSHLTSVVYCTDRDY